MAKKAKKSADSIRFVNWSPDHHEGGLLRKQSEAPAIVICVNEDDIAIAGAATFSAVSKGLDRKIPILEAIMAWEKKIPGPRRQKGTLKEFFEANIAPIPYEQRPYAHEVRAASRKFYNGVAAWQQKEFGAKLSDVFPLKAGTGGGAQRPERELTPEKAMAIVLRRREYARQRRKALKQASHPS